MAPKFGTSGMRGLATELTPTLVGDYVQAFLAVCDIGSDVHVGRYLRASSPAITHSVIDAVRAAGVDAVDCGVLPTPALALSASDARAAAIMVTGSHIPADRNGLKFYVPGGEITKEDEDAITAALWQGGPTRGQGPLSQDPGALARYRARDEGVGSELPVARQRHSFALDHSVVISNRAHVLLLPDFGTTHLYGRLNTALGCSGNVNADFPGLIENRLV